MLMLFYYRKQSRLFVLTKLLIKRCVTDIRKTRVTRNQTTEVIKVNVQDALKG